MQISIHMEAKLSQSAPMSKAALYISILPGHFLGRSAELILSSSCLAWISAQGILGSIDPDNSI